MSKNRHAFALVGKSAPLNPLELSIGKTESATLYYIILGIFLPGMSSKVFRLLASPASLGTMMLVVIGASMSCSLYFAENIPLLDDYGLCLQFLGRFEAAASWSDGLALIFHFENGHPIVLQNLMFILDRKLFGQVNFQHFIYMNNLGHLVLIFISFKLFRLFSNQLLFFTPILLLMAVPVFTLNNWSSSFIHVSTLVFSLGSLYALAKTRNSNLVWASILAVLACLSSGSGLLVFFASIPILIRYHSKKTVISWTALGVLACLWYLVNYLFFSDPETVNFSREVNLLTYLINFAVFFGTIFKPLYADHFVLGALFGPLILCGLALVVVAHEKDLWNKPLLLSGIIYALLLAMATTLTRSQFGIGATTAYRYRFYQMIPLVFLYLSYLSYHPGKEYRGVISIFSLSILLYFFSMEDSWHEFRNRSMQLRNGLMVYQVMGDPNQLTNRNVQQAGHDIEMAIALKIYHPAGIKLPQPGIEKAGMYSSDMTVVYERKVRKDTYIYLQGWSFLNGNSIAGTEIHIGFKSNGLIYHYPTSTRVSPVYPLPVSNHSFSFVLPISQVDFPIVNGEVYIMIYHQLQGVLAATRVDFE